MKKRFFTLISLMCMAIVSAFAQSATAERFYLGITGYNGSTPATASFSVFEDFHFVAALPTVGNDLIGANKATVDVRLTDVPSLGVSGVKSYTNTFETATLTKSNLSEWIPSAYNFKGITLPLTVKDDNGQDVFTYNIAGATADSKIVGTPDSYDNAHAAWTRFTSHITTGTSDVDSRVIVKSGAYAQVGTEKLTFNSDATVFEGNWTFGEASNTIKGATTLESNAVSGEDTYKAIFFVPAGSALYLGGMYAILNDDCTVTIDATAGYSGKDFTLGLEDLKNATTNRERLELLLTMFDDAMAVIGSAGNIPVLVDFTKEQPILTVYPANEQAIFDQTVSQFEEIRQTIPNAVAFTSSDNADLVKGVDNVVVEYTVGAAKNKYYECENFVLTDKKDFYTPNNFIAVKGEYSRVPAAASYAGASYNSFCLPFAFEASQLSSTASILTFSYYEEKNGDRNAYFNEITSINAGNPCVVNDLTVKWDVIVFDNTEIFAKPDNDGNMKGSFVKTDAYQEGNYYCVVPEENKFGPLQSSITAFRSCLNLDEGVIIPTSSKDQYINIVILDPTAINEVNADRNNNSAIYNIAGQMVTKNIVPGIYVKNGKKFIVK